MLFRLRMEIGNAIRAYGYLASQVFCDLDSSEESMATERREKLAKAIVSIIKDHKNVDEKAALEMLMWDGPNSSESKA